VTGGNQLGQRQYFPSITVRAVGRELVVVGVQAREGAEVDHGARIRTRQAQAVSLPQRP